MNFKIGLAQINPTLGDLRANLDKYDRSIESAIKDSVELLIFPELSLTGYFLRDMVADIALRLDSEEVRDLLTLSEKLSLVVGFVEETDDYRFYNSSVYLEDGQIKHVHRKVYLPTYGMFDEQRYFASGDRLRAFDTKFGRMGMLICEDLWHLSCPYILCCDKMDYLIGISNSPGRGLSHPDRPATVESWEQINRVYAKFFCIYVFYANRVGYEDGVYFWGGAEAIAPNGETVAKAGYHDESLITAQIKESTIRRTRIFSPLGRDEKHWLTLAELRRINDERLEDQY